MSGLMTVAVTTSIVPSAADSIRCFSPRAITLRTTAGGPPHRRLAYRARPPPAVAVAAVAVVSKPGAAAGRGLGGLGSCAAAGPHGTAGRQPPRRAAVT